MTEWDRLVGADVPLFEVEPVRKSFTASLGPVVNAEMPDELHPVVLVLPDRGGVLRYLRSREQRLDTVARAFGGVTGVAVVWVSPDDG